MWRIARDSARSKRVAREHRAAQDRFRHGLRDLWTSQDWFSRHIPTWLDIFERRGLLEREGLRILEIGSWEGLSCRFLLDSLPGSVITCIDTWSGSDEHGDGSAVGGGVTAGIEARFDHNTHGYEDRVVKWKGTSQSYFAARAPRECFDLVYVDGSHRADDVLVDALLGFEALAVGGVMVFDDYLWKHYPRARDNPGAAINAFLRLKRDSYALLHAGSQVAIAKTHAAIL